jgi:hypothetical protein
MTAATKAEAMAILESAWRDLDARFASAFWWRLAARGARRATEIDDLRAAIAQLPALNHLRQHAEHITAALGKEGAVT